MTFKPGDLVRLKSGGHVMTVQGLFDHEGERCVEAVWSYEGCIWTHNFAEEALEPATQADGHGSAPPKPSAFFGGWTDQGPVLNRAPLASGLPPCEGNCTDHDGGCGKPGCVWVETTPT